MAITVCVDEQCGPASDRFSREQLLGGLLVMLKANENSIIELCTLDESDNCTKDAIRYFVQGGPMPGIASYREPYLSQVGFDKETSQIKFVLDADVTWIGTPVFCQDAFTEMEVDSADRIVFGSTIACTWTAVPHIWSFDYEVEQIDFDQSIIFGNYSIGGIGALTIGGGSGRFQMRFGNERTLTAGLAKGERQPGALPTVAELPPEFLAAPIPEKIARDVTVKEKDPAERVLWEEVSKNNTPEGYMRYLARYPGGSFADAAAGRLKVAQERARQDRELAEWGRIRESQDPEDFEAYLTRYPGGIFLDAANARLKELNAGARDAAALREEIKLWDRVKTSTEIDTIELYLARYPNGQFASSARSRIKKLNSASRETDDLELAMWNQVKESRNISDFQGFLQAFPEGVFAEIAKSRIEILVSMQEQAEELAFWSRIEKSRDPKDFEAYLKKYPEGQYADYARDLHQRLIEIQVAEEDLHFWEAIKNSSNPDDFERYLLAFPLGRFAETARERQIARRRQNLLSDIDLGRYFALVIGNNAYQNLQPLRTAENDARRVGKILRESYGFEVTEILNGSRKTIIDTLSEFRRKLKKTDNFLIYYAGHGWLDKDAGRGYWLPVDADRDSPSNWISTGDISDTLRAIQAKHVLVVADSCYSGTLARAVRLDIPSSEYLRRVAEKRARIALTSGGLEPVLDDGREGHSVFAKAFIDILEKNSFVLEGSRLFNELRPRVMLNSPQTPEYSDILYAGHEGGRLLFLYGIGNFQITSMGAGKQASGRSKNPAIDKLTRLFYLC
jgi:outer membrane protein assembly factor BamD (BamD/ComL family)